MTASFLLLITQKPPTSIEGLLKAREKILEERRKERAQNKTES